MDLKDATDEAIKKEIARMERVKELEQIHHYLTVISDAHKHGKIYRIKEMGVREGSLFNRAFLVMIV